MGDPPRGTLTIAADRLEYRVRPSASAACWAALTRLNCTAAGKRPHRTGPAGDTYRVGVTDSWPFPLRLGEGRAQASVGGFGVPARCGSRACRRHRSGRIVGVGSTPASTATRQSSRGAGMPQARGQQSRFWNSGSRTRDSCTLRRPRPGPRRMLSVSRNSLEPPNGWPLSCGRHQAYHGRPTPGTPDLDPRSVAPTRSAVSFSGLLGGVRYRAQISR